MNRPRRTGLSQLRMAQLATQQEEAKVTQARSEQAPDFALWGSYMVPLRSDMERTFTVGIQTSILAFQNQALQQEAERCARNTNNRNYSCAQVYFPKYALPILAVRRCFAIWDCIMMT
ncbi:MAG: hypothetical protein U0787_06820 [Polyangia bacterium]